MEIIRALILGIIEGITEFLPISSTAHLIIGKDLIGFKDTAEVFTVVIQLGAILAAGWYFRQDLIEIIKGAPKSKAIYKFIRNIILALIPSVVIGLIVEKTVGLPDSPVLISIALIIGGIIFLAVERYQRHASDSKDTIYESLSTRRSWIIGAGQAIALIPGVSRSGATIIAGLISGLDRKTATIISFYLSIPLMIGASSLKLIDEGVTIESIDGGWIALLVGVATSFVIALIVIKWLLKYVQTHSFVLFGYYRILIGVVILFLVSSGNL